MKKATYLQTKHHNRDLVLHTILASETTSRAEIARLTALTRTTVSEVISGLLAEGLVEEVGRGPSIGGKNPTLLSIIPDSRYFIGLDLGQKLFTGAIVNLRGEIRGTAEVAMYSDNGQVALEAVYRIIEQLLRTKHSPVVAIGIGTPGLVNTQSGMVIEAVNRDWQNLPLRSLLRDRFKLPVSIVNDSQAAAIGEHRFGGRSAAKDNLVVVNVNHGIGAGILIHGRLFSGDYGSAGEIGHMTVQEKGTLCRCGKTGCLETVASASAVLRQLELDSIEAACAAFEGGDARARQVVTAAGAHLGTVLASLVGTLNIHRILLTGEMTRFGSPWLAEVTAAMQRTAIGQMNNNVRVEIGALGNRACILGAAASLLLDNYSLLFRKEI